MQRLRGYRIDGIHVSPEESPRPDIYVIVDKVLEIRRDASRNVDEFRGEFTLEEAEQLYIALGELLPKAAAAKTATEETTFP